MSSRPARLYLWSGLIRHGALRAYWISLVVRLAISLELPGIQLVLLGTAMEGALLLAEVPTGVVADTISRKWSVVAGFILLGVAQMGAGVVETFPLFVATQVLWGVAYTFISGAETAWVTDELGGPNQVEDLILRRARLQQLVAIVAIIGGAVLGRLTTLTVSIVLTGAILIVTGIVLAVMMPETGFRPDPYQGSGTGRLLSTARAGARSVAGVPVLRTLVVVLILAGLASEAVDRLDLRRLDDLGLSEQFDEILLVGAIGATEALLGLVLLSFARSRAVGARVPVGFAILLGSSALGIAALGLVASLPIAAAGLIMQAGLRQATAPLSVTWTNTHAPSHVRATVHSFIEQANSVGEIGGGVILGAVAAATTVPTAMLLSTILILLAAMVATRGRRLWNPVEVAAPAS